MEITRTRHRAELVTSDAKMLREQLEIATGERVSALKGYGAAPEKPLAERIDRGHGLETGPETANKGPESPDRNRDAGPEMSPRPKRIDLDLGM